MIRFILMLVVVALASSCASSKLYYWGQYDQATYNHNKKQTEESLDDLLNVYEDIISKKDKGTRGVVPPGVYADYGFLLIQNGRIDEGKLLLEKELSLYPESKKTVEYILNKF